MKVVLGIDIGKQSFDVALLKGKKFYCKKFGNSRTGFTKLQTWLNSKEVSTAHAGMEATGKYGDHLATWLCEKGYKVSVVNPASIKGFAQSQLTRSKTDKGVAKLIAKFTETMNPGAWQPLAPEVRILRDWVLRSENLKKMLVQEKNRLDLQANEEIHEHISKHIKWLEAELCKLEQKISNHIDSHPDLKKKFRLLNSIPGVGEKTSATVLAHIHFDRFKSAKELGAFIGVNPRQHLSGTSVRGRTRLSKTGNVYLRKSLYLPAMTAIRFNSTIKHFADRLSKNGKNKMVIIGASMRKLLHIMYGVLKSGREFDATYVQESSI